MPAELLVRHVRTRGRDVLEKARRVVYRNHGVEAAHLSGLCHVEVHMEGVGEDGHLLRQTKVDVLDEDDVTVCSEVALAPLHHGATVLGRDNEVEVYVGKLVSIAASDRALEENRLAEAVGNCRASDARNCLVKAHDARDVLDIHDAPLVQRRPSPGPSATQAR